MARSIDSNNLTAAQATDTWIIDFVKVVADPNDSDKVLRLTNHSSNITFNNEEYLAVGHFLGFSTIADDLDAKDNSISVSLSGVQSAFTAIFLDNNIEGSPVELFRGYFNESTGLLVADPELRWSGFVNNYDIKDDHRGADTDTIALTLNCKSLLTTILGRTNGRFTSAAGISDKSFDFVAGLANFNPAFGKEN